MCIVIEFKGRTTVAKVSMTVDEAEALIGEGLMYDELESLRELSDDASVIEACDIILAARHS